MKNNRSLELTLSLLFLLLIYVTRGAYLYFGEGLSPLQAIRKVIFEFGNLLIIFMIGLIATVVVLSISSRLSKKKKDKENHSDPT